MDVQWKLLHPKMTMDHLGFLPSFLQVEDPRPVSEQINERYAHGGGWSPYGKGKWKHLGEHTLKFPGDPPLKPLAEAKLRRETVVFYESAVLAVFQPDGTFEVTRVD